MRDTVQAHVGPVAFVEDLTDGQNSGVATVLHRATAAPVFLKGVEG